MNVDKNITASFTGHRNYDNIANKALEEQICSLYAEGYRIFLCGMARGFDLAAGECVIKLQKEFPELRLKCIIPFRGQEQSFSKRDRERFIELTEQAEETIILAEKYTTGAYHQRNNYLVDNASAVVAYYNGEKGGTHYTLHRAVKHGLRIHNICSQRIGELFNDLK